MHNSIKVLLMVAVVAACACLASCNQNVERCQGELKKLEEALQELNNSGGRLTRAKEQKVIQLQQEIEAKKAECDKWIDVPYARPSFFEYTYEKCHEYVGSIKAEYREQNCDSCCKYHGKERGEVAYDFCTCK